MASGPLDRDFVLPQPYNSLRSGKICENIFSLIWILKPNREIKSKMLITSRATRVTVGPFSPQARTSLTINHFHPEIEWIFLQNKYLLGISDEVGSMREWCNFLFKNRIASLSNKKSADESNPNSWRVATGNPSRVTSMTHDPPINHKIAQIHSTTMRG